VDDELERLVVLAGQRLATADAVAAAKWRTGGSISDPAREKVVLDAVAARSAARGLDPDESVAFFRDQIEASKVVQYGLFSAWSAEPAHAPQNGTDLGEVRPVLDEITPELLDQLAATRLARTCAGCVARLRDVVDVIARAENLDPLHRRGLERAVRSLCSPQ
jgi:chorismate mutase